MAAKKPPKKRMSKAKPKVDPNVKTARNSRRVLKTGTVADQLALLPAPATNRDALNGPNVPRDLTAAPEPAPYRLHVRYDDKDVMLARAFLRSSNIVGKLQALVDAEKDAVGRPQRVSIEAVLVAMWLAANSGRPMLITEFTDILFYGLNPPMRRMLNVREGANPRSAIPRKRRRWDKASALAVGRRFNQMTSVIDPCDEITPRANVDWVDMEYRGLTDDDQARLQALLDWVCNQILQVTYDTLPASMRRFDKGDRCIDATPLRQFVTPRGLDNPQASSMPHAANYVRDGDHMDPAENTTPRRNRKGPAKFFPALDLHLLSAADTTPGLWQRIPGIMTSMTSDRAALDPAGAARRMFASEINRGFTPGYLTGDNLYAKAADVTFQIPAREAGYKLILPIPADLSGVQGSHKSGAVLTDGTYYGPCLPDDLRTIVADFREKRISHAAFVAMVRARKKYELVTKENARNGVGERVGCRAGDHSLTVICKHKPASKVERTTVDRDGNLTDTRPIINTDDVPLTNDVAPSICQSQTITLKVTDGAKYRQAIPFGTDESTDIHNRLRQTQEGMHGFAKDEAKEALGTPGRRRIRTKVAQQLFAAFLIAAANLRKIRSFFERAEIDANGDYYVVRTPRKGDHARTGIPPGAEAPLEPPTA